MAGKKLNGSVIATYRCNARCTMCNRYNAPSKPEEEISLETIRKLPPMYFTNITGGEVTKMGVALRKNILDIAVTSNKGTLLNSILSCIGYCFLERSWRKLWRKLSDTLMQILRG